MANKITERDIYNSILNDSFDVDVLKAFAEKKIAQLDKRNATAKTRAERKRAEGDALIEAVLSFVTAEPKNRAQIAAEFNAATGSELSDAKIGARLSKLAREGRVVKTEVKDLGMTYTLAE